MNNKRLGKLFMLALLLAALCCLLSGCIKDPNNNHGVGTPTWKTYTTQPSLNPETPMVVTPTPDPGQQSWEGLGISTATPTIGIATPYVPPTATPSPTPTVTPTSSLLRLGSQGDAVANVQAALKRLGYFEGKTDGDFGEYTENAVKSFQEQNGLTPDGIVGPSTLAKLSSSSAKTARPTATPTPKPTNTPSYQNTYLENGSRGAKVTQLQTRLISLGYLEGSASSSFCDITEMAVISFQTRNSLDSDGVAGPGTLEKLYSSSARKASGAVGIIGVSLKNGDENSDAVRLLQTKLKSYGFYSGNIDGDFGAGTEDAVKAFQRANGLTADGKAGSSTLNKLFAGSVTTASGSSSNNNKTTPKPTVKPTEKTTKKPTATPKKAATPTPNAYVRVTERPDGEYFTLEKGMMGEPIKKLQRALRSAGYYSGTIDGYYGEGTVEAVKEYQEDKGLKKDGKAGPATLRYLYEGDFPDGA